MNRFVLVAAVLFGSLLGACPSVDSEGSGAPCVDEGDCHTFDGSAQACIDGACTQVDCLSSSDCPFDSYCDVSAFDCDPGCVEDTDCSAGSRCRQGFCQDRGCRDALLDCDFGEVCDDNVCQRPAGAFCNACDPNAHEWAYNGPGNCDDVPIGHPLCGSWGNFCLANATMNYCAVECTEQADCPNGSTCSVITFERPDGCAGEPTLQIGRACLSSCRPD